MNSENTPEDRPEGQARRIGFLLRGRNGPIHVKIYAEFLSALAEKTSERSIQAVIFVHERIDPFDMGFLPDLAIPEGRITFVRCRFDESFAETLAANPVDCIFAVGPGSRYQKIQELTRPMGVKWISLPHNHVELYFFQRDLEISLANWDLIFVISEKARSIALTLIEEARPDLLNIARQKIAARGNPLFDQLEAYDRTHILEKYNLPSDKRIVVFCPYESWRAAQFWPTWKHTLFEYCLTAPGLLWQASKVLGTLLLDDFIDMPRMNYRETLRLVRQYCDAHNGYLVVKRKPATMLQRRMWTSSPYAMEERYADLIVDDVSYFHFSTLEICSVSDLYVGFNSTMAIEAVAGGAYAVSLFRMDRNKWRNKTNQVDASFYIEPLIDGKGGVMDFPGLSERINIYTDEGVQRFRNIMKSGSFARIDERASECAENILGTQWSGQPLGASTRTLDFVLEKFIQE